MFMGQLMICTKMKVIHHVPLLDFAKSSVLSKCHKVVTSTFPPSVTQRILQESTLWEKALRYSQCVKTPKNSMVCDTVDTLWISFHFSPLR